MSEIREEKKPSILELIAIAAIVTIGNIAGAYALKALDSLDRKPESNNYKIRQPPVETPENSSLFIDSSAYETRC